jgi:GTP-binding protein Era
MAEAQPDIRARAVEAWDAGEAALKEALRKELVVAFLGSASSGKDSAIRALFGLDFGEISPIPGSTARVRVARLAEQVLLVNAPGFGDVRAEVDALARQALDAVDVVVYVVNCEGGATIDEKRDLAAVRERGRPTLVCLNKIDLIRPAQRAEFVSATLAQLDVVPKDAAVCAFDPLPQLAPEPIGAAVVIDWIWQRLEEQGKSLLFAKQLRNKAAACEPIIQAAARNAAIAGAVPIPGADLAAVTAVQVKLIRDIAEVHGAPMTRDVAVFIIGEILSGSMRGFVRWGVEALKAAGLVPGGQVAEAAILALSSAVAGASTYGVGMAALKYIQSGRTLEVDALQQVFDSAAWDWKKRLDAAR